MSLIEIKKTGEPISSNESTISNPENKTSTSKIRRKIADRVKMEKGYEYYVGDDRYLWKHNPRDAGHTGDERVGKVALPIKEGYEYRLQRDGRILIIPSVSKPQASPSAARKNYNPVASGLVLVVLFVFFGAVLGVFGLLIPFVLYLLYRELVVKKRASTSPAPPS